MLGEYIKELLDLDPKELDAHCMSTLEQNSADLADDYIDLQEELAPLLDYLNILKGELAERHRFKGDHGRLEANTATYGRVSISYRKPSVRVSWDSKALEGYAAAHPEILPFRRESQVKSGATIKILPE